MVPVFVLDQYLAQSQKALQGPIIENLSLHVSIKVFNSRPHLAIYTSVIEKCVKQTIYPDCIKCLMNIKKTTEHLTAPFKHMIDSF